MHELFQSFDTTVARQIAKLPAWSMPFLAVITYAGIPAVVVTASLVLSILLYAQGKKNVSAAFVLVVAALGANSVVKHLIHRERPDTMYVQSMAIRSYSFPSGHAFGSMVFYGLIAYLCYRHLPQPFGALVPVCLAILILLIGLSRVFLGAHFPSDVVVGWLLGGVALAIIIKICGL